MLLVAKWGEFMKDLDLFIGAPTADTSPNAQTGHPCAVLPYKFDVPVQRGGGGRPAGAASAGTAAAAVPPTPPQPKLNPQPICAVITGALYNDDKILSVAHQFQRATDIHLKRPTMT